MTIAEYIDAAGRNLYRRSFERLDERSQASIIAGVVMTMESWIVTAQEAVRRSLVAREELREEAQEMFRNDEYEAARRLFDDILEEPMPEADTPAALTEQRDTA